MNLTSVEFASLSKEFSEKDVKISQLQAENASLKKENEMLREENMQLKDHNQLLETINTAAKLNNLILKNYIILSVEKIKQFMASMSNFDRWAFLRSFVSWAVPEELKQLEQHIVDDTMKLPEEGNKSSFSQQNNFYGNVGQNVGHTDMITLNDTLNDTPNDNPNLNDNN
ncbi:MAG: hypothetical protein IJ891_03250 [Prevotella sp.]|nr:hypothetical protein [Prevotella sp.]